MKQAQDATEKRKLLEVEKEITPELMLKYAVSVGKVSLCVPLCLLPTILSLWRPHVVEEPLCRTSGLQEQFLSHLLNYNLSLSVRYCHYLYSNVIVCTMLSLSVQ